jgi:hypothetical protein
MYGASYAPSALIPFSVFGYRFSVKKTRIISKLKLQFIASETVAHEPLALSKSMKTGRAFSGAQYAPYIGGHGGPPHELET